MQASDALGFSDAEPIAPRHSDLFHRTLQSSALFRRYQLMFLKSHGLSLRLLSANEKPLPEEHIPTAFCRMVAENPLLAAHCRAALCVVQNRTRGAGQTIKLRCRAGLTEIAIPIVVGGGHIATLLAGRVLDHIPKGADFSKLKKLLGKHVSASRMEKLRQAFLRTRVVDAEQLKFLMQILASVAEHLAQQASSMVMHPSVDKEPTLVKRVKEIITTSIVNLDSVHGIAEIVHCNPDYLERIFKANTGGRLGDFMRLARIEKAKQSLAKRRQKIAVVAHEVGFGSVSQFNKTFKKIAGCTPTEWRTQSSSD